MKDHSSLAATERDGRLLGLLPKLFSEPELRDSVVLSGGLALNLALRKISAARSRPITDIDLRDMNPAGAEWYDRANRLVDGLRSACDGGDYEFQARVANSSKAWLYYTNGAGERDALSIDVNHAETRPLLPTIVQTADCGGIPSLALEELVGGKIAMLSRARLRGKKRFSDLVDCYNATYLPAIDSDALRHTFLTTMTGLGITVSSDKMREMLSWHAPEKTEEGIYATTGLRIGFDELRSGIQAAYNSLCRLTPAERAYNREGVAAFKAARGAGKAHQ